MPGWEALARADLVPLRRAVRPGQLQHDPPPHRAPAPQPPAAGIAPPQVLYGLSSLAPAAAPASSTVLRTVGGFLITSLKQPNKVLVVGPDFLGDVIAWNRSCTRCCGIEVALLWGRFGGHDRRSSLVRFIAHAGCSSNRPFSRNVGSVPASASVPLATGACGAHLALSRNRLYVSEADALTTPKSTKDSDSQFGIIIIW